MANFGNLTGRVRARAAKFRERIFEKIPAPVQATLRGADAVVNATRRFLSSIASELTRQQVRGKKEYYNHIGDERTVLRLRALEELRIQTREEIRILTRNFAQGQLDQAAFTERLQSTLRNSALTSAILGVGGVGNLSPNVLEAMERQLTRQFKQLDGLIDEVAQRGMTRQDQTRFLRLGDSAYRMSTVARQQSTLDDLADQGPLEEKRVLGGSDHCADCVAYAEEGWVPAGTLPPPGTRSVCGDNCRCTLITRPASSNVSNPPANTLPASNEAQ